MYYIHQGAGSQSQCLDHTCKDGISQRHAHRSHLPLHPLVPSGKNAPSCHLIPQVSQVEKGSQFYMKNVYIT